MKRKLFLLLTLVYTLGCKSPMFTSSASTPHAKYSEGLKKADLDSTAIGKAWFNAASRSLTNPLTISLPYREAGYFDGMKIPAAGYKFSARRGERLRVNIMKKPSTGFNIFMELWNIRAGTSPSLEEALAVDQTQLITTIKKDGEYIIRLQPELLSSGEYTLVIETGPSLAFPVLEKADPKIGSFWGDRRDAGARSHEGIDIFAPRRTPLIAATSGTVSSVSENNLGGKVIFLRDRERGISLYYAHLDSQLVSPGQRVEEGEVIGLVGNTGNAKSTAPHLHFGIYTGDGPIDPLPFVQKKNVQPPTITVSIERLNSEVRTGMVSKLYSSIGKDQVSIRNTEENTLMFVHGATANYYKVTLPDGTEGFVPGNNIISADKSIRNLSISVSTPLFDRPDTNAATKTILQKGDKVLVLAVFNEFSYVKKDEVSGWIK